MPKCLELYSFLLYSVDIEAQMTMFAYYYIGIGLAVLIVSYFQVGQIKSLFMIIVITATSPEPDYH